MIYIGIGFLIVLFGLALLIKKINILSMFVDAIVILVGNFSILVRPILGYGMEIFTEIKTLGTKYIILDIILVLFTVAIIGIGIVLSLRRYKLYNITMGKTEDVCINKYKGITVDYSKGFKENNKGFEAYKNGTITIDFNDNRNKLKITPGDNIKGAELDLKKVKDRELRKGIIRSIKEEIKNNESNSSWCSYGLIHIILGCLVVFVK